jgi:hypothetical protein
MPQTRPDQAPNQHMISSHALHGYTPINKNKGGPPRSAVSTAEGLVTTFICTNADATDFAVGDKFRLFLSTGVLKENKLFTITVEAVDTPGAGSTTFTFTPAAAAVTAIGNYISNAQDISDIGDIRNYQDIASIDARLMTINSGVYTQLRLNSMTLNDKLHAIKLNDEAEF